MTLWPTTGAREIGQGDTSCCVNLSFNPSSLSSFCVCSAPSSLYLHTADLLWGRVMLVFGGSGKECFSDLLLVYNIG